MGHPPRRRPPSFDDARATVWALRAIRTTRHQLRVGRFEDLCPPAPRTSETRSRRAVARALDLRRCSCLERAVVYQAWYAARGQHRDVIIGVTGPRDFAAHAWLEGDARCHEQDFEEIARISPPLAAGSAGGDRDA